MKLGPHLMLGGRGWPAAVWKLVDNFERLPDAPASALVIGRSTSEAGVDWHASPMACAEQVVYLMSDAVEEFPRVDAWEVRPNEPVFDAYPVTAREQMTWHGVYSYECARRLARLGKRAVLGSWAVGTPPIELWANWTTGLRAAGDFGAIVGRHSYGPLDNWYALRHRRDAAEWTRLGYAHIPIVISECGTDDVLLDGVRLSSPWRVQYGDAAAYWREWCVPFLEQIEQDPDVLGACLFTSGSGGDPRWQPYDVADTPIPDQLAALPQERDPMPIVVIDTPAPLRGKVLEHLLALADDADQRGDIHPYGVTPPPPWWHTLRSGDKLRFAIPAWIYRDAALSNPVRQLGAGDVIDVWQSRGGATWAGEAVCVFTSGKMELWAPAAALERA